MNQLIRQTENAIEMIAPVALGISLGWIVWLASPFVTGDAEPWDSMTFYYSGSLLASGFVSSIFWKRGFYLGPIGIFIGQIAYMWTFSGKGFPIFPAPLAVAVFGTIQPVAGAAIGWFAGREIRARQCD